MTEDDKYRGTTSIYPFLTKEASAGLTVSGQTSCAITGAPDIPYFSPEDRRFRQLLQEVTLPAALSPFHQPGVLCAAGTQATSSLHHSGRVFNCYGFYTIFPHLSTAILEGFCFPQQFFCPL